jgi:PAS domain S-box-containing protein
MRREFPDTVRVLHVDDDPHFADLAATLLERRSEHLTVETAARASEGLAAIEGGGVDCVVSDFDMPGLNGIEFLEAVRELDPALPFILFTGKGSEAVASDAISAGVTDYLQKESGTEQYAVLANRIDNAVEHHRSRRLVDRSERRLRKIVDSLPHLLFVVDGDGRYLLANETLASFHGESVECIEGSRVADVLDATRAEQFRADAENVLETGRSIHLPPVELAGPGDETRVLEPRLRSYDCHDERAVLGIAVDVTDRERRKADLEREGRRYRAMFDDPNILVGLLDPDGTVRDVNRTALEYVPDDADVIGRPFPETAWFDGTDDASAVEECIERAAEGEYVDFELSLAGATGETSVVAGVFKPVTHDGEVVSIFVTSRDVTERKRHERELEALNATTQELMAADTSERIAEIGVEAAEEILGLDASSIHLHDEERGLVPVACTDALVAVVGEPPTFTGGESIAWRTYERGDALAIDDVREDPNVLDPTTPIRSELYLPLGEHGILIAGATDVGAFDQQDVVLGSILAGNVATALEQAARNRQLRAQERALARRNESLESLAGILSHDLRSPLNVATGQLELAMAECANERLPAVERSLDRMETLIDDLLTLAREGDRIGETEAVDLADLCRRCWETIETDGASLRVDADRAVDADRSRLRQLIENLFRNAVEHGTTGNRPQPDDAVEHGSTGNRTRPDDAVEHGSTDDGLTVTVGDLEGGFYVADDGTGIPPERREAVFDEGYTTADGGTGLGLQIVTQIADAHGWTVGIAESDAGGTRFEIADVE